MPSNNINFTPINRMAVQIADIVTERSDAQALSAQNLLDHIENFFMGGYVGSQHIEQYDSFAKALAGALHRPFMYRSIFTIPQTLIVGFSGCRVTFIHLGESLKTGPAIVEVSKDGESVKSEIDKNIYCRVCTVLLIRQQLDLAHSAITLNSSGNIAMAGINLSTANLSGIDLRYADLSGVDLKRTKLNFAKLEKANLSKANLQGANLTGANLQGAGLEAADLSWAELSEAKLNGAIMRRANLEEANLRAAELGKTDLCHANLTNTYLVHAILYRATLCGAMMDKATLRKATLRGANLSGANLRKADLREANLRNADLREANLRKADLREANLREATLSGANLSGADLHKANLHFANLQEANLSGANLNQVDLQRADLQTADLSNADLTGADLLRGNLKAANLSGAILKNSILIGVELNGANLGRDPQADSLLLLPRWTPCNLDLYLNHVHNTTSGSLLTMMDSIDERYASLKVKMARKIMKSLKNIDISSVTQALLDVLAKAPYDKDNAIARWLEKICEQLLVQYNNRVMEPLHKNTFKQVVGLFKRRPERMFSDNGAFIQLIYQGVMSRYDDVKTNVTGLYHLYLSHEKVKRYTALDDFGNYGEQRPDWKNEFAANYILVSSQPGGPVMLLSQQTLKGMLVPDPANPVWGHYYLYNSLGQNSPPDVQPENLKPGDHPPRILFRQHFKLFLGPFVFANNQAGFTKLFEILFEGDLRQVFIAATRATRSDRKLVSASEQIMLREIFSPILSTSTASGDYGLTKEHYGAIIKAYGLSTDGDTHRGKVLLSLAALFTKFSSSAIFGTELDSPEMIRRYAYALMAKAHALDASIFERKVGSEDGGNDESVDNFTDWKNHLLGLNDAFTCAGVLTHAMLGHIRDRFPDVLADIIPPAWNL
ncbi:pentapeptide repeat-containing protein [Acerihabitans sp.]|uniref:pentapeptide repeat-containing protein n=1 Tax=Acerihabitans sp. TaxID=2811394 RepID=UPI002EDB3003